MTHHTRGMTLAAGLALAAWGFATTASAQGPGERQGRGGDRGGPGGWGGPGGQPDMARLLANPAVQEDLKLNDKQKKQIEVVRGDGQKQMETLRGSMPRRGRGDNNNNGDNGDGGDQQQFDREAMMGNMMAMRQNVETAYSKVLDAKQRKRLGEIALRQEGPRAVARQEIAMKLNMSDAQFAQVQAVVEQGQQGQRQLRESQRDMFRQGMGGAMTKNGNDGNQGRGAGGAPPDQAKMREFFQSKEFQAQMAKNEEQRKVADDQIVAGIGKVLTKKQRASFDKLLGEPFDIEKLRGGPGRPGGPGGPGGREEATKTQVPAKAGDASKNGESTKAAPKASTTRRRTPA